MELINFIDESPTSFQAVENIKKELLKEGYEELKEEVEYKIVKGKKYFVTRNGSSILAFNIGKKLNNPAFMITASHDDCPSFKVKPEAFISGDGKVQLNTEVYGGPIFYPWFDRPLSLAGRVIINKKDKVEVVSYMDKKPFCIIPSVAIHMNKEINKQAVFNPQIDLLPLVSLNKGDFKEYLAENLKVKKDDIGGFDLYLYPTIKAFLWGKDDEFISSYHLDNLECAYTTLKGFINNFNDDNINVYACFDNEEVGSRTLQGAASDFLEVSLKRICESLKIDYYASCANSMMLSCDNAHAIHPNHPEKADPVNHPKMNKGIVIKYNANQSYTSDGLTGAIFKKLLDSKKIPYQYFTNRSDSAGGGTLGNIALSHVSIKALDIGLAQLAMHSPLETAGSKDVEYMIDAIKLFYSCKLISEGNGYTLKHGK